MYKILSVLSAIILIALCFVIFNGLLHAVWFFGGLLITIALILAVFEVLDDFGIIGTVIAVILTCIILDVWIF